MAALIKTFDVTIDTSSGGGPSGVLSLEGTTPFALVMPAAWTSASITLQGSDDGSSFLNMYKDDGTEYALTVDASQYVVLQNPEQFLGLNALKLRSGTSGTPVQQAAERTITVLARGL